MTNRTQTHATPVRIAAAAVAVLAFQACQRNPAPPARTLAAPAAQQGVGDRDDLFGVVFAAAVRHEMAITDVAYPDPDTRVYLLKSIRDEPVTLTLTGPGLGLADTFRAPPDLRTGAIDATASIGRFGAPAREDAFVADVLARLERIEGDRAAPLNW